MSRILDWLSTRQPSAPFALSNRIAEVVAAHPEWEAMPRSLALMAAGEELLSAVLAAAPKDRRAALDLLAADACVTYALEAAADAPDSFVQRADDATHRIARLAANA